MNDVASRIKDALASGEGKCVEFKAKYVSNIGHSICSFANTAGGLILVGISDSNRVVGIKAEKANKLKSDIQHLLQNCDPYIDATIEVILWPPHGEDRKYILAITVEEGGGKLHLYNGTAYVRRGASNGTMTPAEIVDAAVQSGMANFDHLPCEEFDYQTDFDPDKLSAFLTKAKLKPPVNGGEMRAPENLGVINKGGGSTSLQQCGGVVLRQRFKQNILAYRGGLCPV